MRIIFMIVDYKFGQKKTTWLNVRMKYWFKIHNSNIIILKSVNNMLLKIVIMVLLNEYLMLKNVE